MGEVLEGLDRREQVWWAMQSGSTSSGCSSSSRRGCTAVGAALLQQVLCLPSLTIAHACKTIDTAASQRPGSVDALAFVAPASDYIVNYTYRHTHTPGYSRSRMVYGSSSSSRSSMGGAPVGGSSSNSSSSSTHARGAHESTHGENKGSLNGSDSGRVNRTVEARAESTGRGSSGSGTGQASSAMRAVAANGRNEGGSGRDSAKKAGPAELWLQNLQASYAEPPSLATTPLSTPPPPGDCKPSDQKRSQQLKQQGSLECVPSGWQSRPCDQHAGTSSHQGRGKEEHSQQLGGCKGDLQEGGGGDAALCCCQHCPCQQWCLSEFRQYGQQHRHGNGSPRSAALTDLSTTSVIHTTAAAAAAAAVTAAAPGSWRHSACPTCRFRGA